MNSKMAPFCDMMDGESLDHFHQRRVVPTPEETKSLHRVIDRFVRFLHSEFNTSPYTVARVLKSGSLGKGTAVRGRADIDLVVIDNGLHSIADLTRQRRELLNHLADLVSRYDWRNPPTLEGRTRYSLRYIVNGHKLDILPAMNIGEVYRSPAKVYKTMESSEDREDMAQEFSASLTHLQKNFVKRQKEAVKKVIRLLKLWNKERNVGIRSYTLELLTIYTSKTAQWSTTDSLFRNVLTRLTDCDSLKVAFDLHYTSSLYTCHHGNHYVLDPANPFMDTLQGTRVDAVSREARKMLERLGSHKLTRELHTQSTWSAPVKTLTTTKKMRKTVILQHIPVRASRFTAVKAGCPHFFLFRFPSLVCRQ